MLVCPKKKLSEFLEKSKLKRFDLSILDRVCYILDTEDLISILKIICENSKYIYIDDFFYSKKSLEYRKILWI